MAPSTICHNIVNTIKNSNLHFLLSENAFSAKITIRKKFIDETRNKMVGGVAESDTVKEEAKSQEIDQLKHKLSKLESAYTTLAANYENEILEAEDLRNKLKITETSRNNLHANFDKLEVNLENVRKGKKELESKHERSCDQLKTLKQEKKDLEKELTSSNLVIQTVKKGAKESDCRYQKVLKKKEDAIEHLLEQNAQNDSKEKELKQWEKKINKKT